MDYLVAVDFELNLIGKMWIIGNQLQIVIEEGESHFGNKKGCLFEATFFRKQCKLLKINLNSAKKFSFWTRLIRITIRVRFSKCHISLVS